MNWVEFDIDAAVKEVLAEPNRKWNDRTLPALGELVPEADDPNVLFKHNWLGRGQAFALVASSGVGKSSMADQMAFHWAVGDEFLACPTRPLKIAIIQAEDSDRDLQEQRDGMIRGLLLEGWSQEKVDEAMERVLFPTDFIGLYGEEFIGRLADYQHDHNCDLIFINPLQRFFGADISSQENASKFCAGLDTVMKSPDTPCGMGIIMHTPKFHTGVKDGRQSVDDYAEYAMAGSQEWTAWIRAVINFQKHGSSEEYFDVKASKRGKRLGWKDANGESITKRIFKHSEGFIYWQEVTDADEIAAIPEEQEKTRGAKQKDDLDIARSASAIAKNHRDDATGKARDVFANHFWNEDHRKHRKSDWLLVFDYLVENADDFGLVTREITNGNRTKSVILL